MIPLHHPHKSRIVAGHSGEVLISAPSACVLFEPLHQCDLIAAGSRWRHDRQMGRARNPSTTPDLFSRASTRGPSSPSAKPPPPSSPTITEAAATAPSPRLVLPKDLPNAIKRIEDQDLDRLLSAALAEQRRRGRKPPVSNEISRKRRVEAVAVLLTQGKLNAVRAAFKAGLTPSRIARQFGLSQSRVRKALAGDLSSRKPR
jgi:hypothetical protein